jgi:hypothetical protein
MWLIGDRRADQGSAVEASFSGCHYAFLRGLVHNGTGRGLTTSRRRARDASSSRPVSFIVSSRLALPIAATARSVAHRSRVRRPRASDVAELGFLACSARDKS